MKTKLYPLLIVLILSLSACEDFLEETSQDLVIPTSVTQFSEIILKEAYQKKEDPEVPIYLELMTDDVSGVDDRKNSEWSPTTNYEERFFGYYTWQKNPQLGRAGNVELDKSWEWFYKSILVCNLIIKKITDKEMEGDENEKNNLLAEAHFLRAWNYFNLVNLYGEPYREATAKSDLGVPINNLTTVSSVIFRRASVAQNYSLIESDLTKAIDNFKNKTSIKNNYFRGNLAASYLLASRVALYQEKYDKVIEYANKGLEIKPALENLEALKAAEGIGDFKPFIAPYNDEVLFTYGFYSQERYQFFEIYGSKPTNQVFGYSQELYGSYGEADLRREYFISDWRNKDQRLNAKPSNYSHGLDLFSFALRTAEFYLNRAEARIETGKVALGMEDINTVRAARYPSDKVSDNSYKLAPTSEKTDRQLVREERRREFCFEGHRWFDIRRWGLSVERTYTFPQGNGQETYKLEENDAAYTLPVPIEVRLEDPNLERINRPVRNPQ